MIFTSLHFKGYSLCYISCQPPVAAVLQSVLRKSEFKECGSMLQNLREKNLRSSEKIRKFLLKKKHAGWLSVKLPPIPVES